MATWELLWFDPVQQELWIFDFLNQQVQKRGFDGNLKGVPLTWNDTMVTPLSWSIRLIDSGGVAWDGSRDTGPYRVEWDLSSRKGHHEVSTGNGVEELAVHPDGHFIAISLDTRYSVGGSRDAVYVFRFPELPVPQAPSEVRGRLQSRHASSTVPLQYWQRTPIPD